MMLQDYRDQAFDVIIQAGQSNAEGYGHGEIRDPFVTDEDLLFCSRDGEITPASTHPAWGCVMSDFSLSFLRAYKKEGLLRSGRKLLVLRTAVGGTGFSDQRWGFTDPLYVGMMDLIRQVLALNPENRPVAFLWHQGETDAINAFPSEQYEAYLTRLILSVRAEFLVPELPFICGDFVSVWRSSCEEKCLPIRQALVNTCCRIGFARFVLTDLLESNDLDCDTIHFCAESLYELGMRYFAAWRSITGK